MLSEAWRVTDETLCPARASSARGTSCCGWSVRVARIAWASTSRPGSGISRRLTRRTRGRERDGQVDAILIVLSDSATNRRLVDELRASLGPAYAHRRRARSSTRCGQVSGSSEAASSSSDEAAAVDSAGSGAGVAASSIWPTVWRAVGASGRRRPRRSAATRRSRKIIVWPTKKSSTSDRISSAALQPRRGAQAHAERREHEQRDEQDDLEPEAAQARAAIGVERRALVLGHGRLGAPVRRWRAGPWAAAAAAASGSARRTAGSPCGANRPESGVLSLVDRPPRSMVDVVAGACRRRAAAGGAGAWRPPNRRQTAPTTWH